MENRVLTVWCNAKFERAPINHLEIQLRPHRLVLAAESTSNLVSGEPDAQLATADVAFGQPDPEQVISLSGLRWVHLNSAGYTAYDREDVRRALQERAAMLTNSSEVYAEPCAEHVLAFMLAHARRLPHALHVQLTTHQWPQEALRIASRLLVGQTVLLVGFGQIARRLVELLQPFRVKAVGVRRHVGGDEPVQTLTEAEADEWLGVADHIVNTLPANPGTRHWVNRERLSRIKRGAVLYNIGRGTTLDQEALIEALRAGQLAAAYLDVTDPEPLPPGHPLWTEPNCFITPHTAGGHDTETERLINHFLENFRRFVGGSPLIDRVM